MTEVKTDLRDLTQEQIVMPTDIIHPTPVADKYIIASGIIGPSGICSKKYILVSFLVVGTGSPSYENISNPFL